MSCAAGPELSLRDAGQAADTLAEASLLLVNLAMPWTWVHSSQARLVQVGDRQCQQL